MRIRLAAMFRLRRAEARALLSFRFAIDVAVCGVVVGIGAAASRFLGQFGS